MRNTKWRLGFVTCYTFGVVCVENHCAIIIPARFIPERVSRLRGVATNRDNLELRVPIVKPFFAQARRSVELEEHACDAHRRGWQNQLIAPLLPFALQARPVVAHLQHYPVVQAVGEHHVRPGILPSRQNIRRQVHACFPEFMSDGLITRLLQEAHVQNGPQSVEPRAMECLRRVRKCGLRVLGRSAVLVVDPSALLAAQTEITFRFALQHTGHGLSIKQGACLHPIVEELGELRLRADRRRRRARPLFRL
mmetsp:Transcript_73754/g.240206  ORF Transcript_73754/g.240206 Transcript_73754/m.240206 type:complete len:251 (+) Transcript_73754:106-858(+)